ncbi:capsular exopolysaccharide family [Clostridium sp. CAG:964]|nr:capsular exopolysaccharide family [Clostridium sp. CAG:964]
MEKKFVPENSRSYTPVGEYASKILTGIKKHWYIIAVLAGICCVGFTLYSYAAYTPQYTAAATFTVTPKGDSLSAYTSISSNASTQQLEKTFPYIITSAPLTRVVAEDLGLSDVPGTLTATAVEDTNLFTITVTSSNYETAYNVLKSVINNYPSVAEYVVGATDLVLVVPPSASSTPINPISYREKALIGTAVGALLGLLIVFFLENLNHTVRHPDEIRKLLNNQRLGSIVKVVKKKSSHSTGSLTIDDAHTDPRFKESVFSIRNKIIKLCADQKINSVMVASTTTNEGKTTVAANLAIALAKKHYRTVIIDCDLRNPTVRQQLNIPESCSLGIVDVITGTCSLQDAIVKTKKNGLYVLPGTIPVNNASELMGSKQLADLVAALEKIFDYVVIDAPPVGIVSDALEMKDYVGGLVFVVRQDYAKVSKILDSISLFGYSKIKILGCIFNMASGVLSTRGYGRYGYNSYGGYGSYGSYGRYGYGYGQYGDYYGNEENSQAEEASYTDSDSADED